MSTAARLLRNAREAAGLTQTELARRAGTSQPTVAAYEAGSKAPSAVTLDRLLRAAGVRIETTPLTRSEQPQVRLRELLRLQGDEIRRIAADHGANNVRVFGSVAHGEDHPGSDVDLLVDMELGRTLLDQVRLRRALIELLGVEVDLVTTRGLLDRDGDPERSHSDLMARRKRRRVDEIVADIGEAAEAAEELVGRGRDAWEKDVLLRLAGEAVMGRIADAASRLPDELKAGIPEVPWDDLRDVRILVDHIYHRIDYDALWGTLRDDVADLLERLRRWQT